MTYKIPPPMKTMQDELVADFHAFGGDAEMALDYLIDLGKRLPPMEEQYYSGEHLLGGCLAKVWMVHVRKNGRVFFHGDSNAMITKGLLAVLFHAFSGQKEEDILSADLSFIKKMGLPSLLGAQRRSGLGNMVAYIGKSVSGKS